AGGARDARFCGPRPDLRHRGPGDRRRRSLALFATRHPRRASCRRRRARDRARRALPGVPSHRAGDGVLPRMRRGSIRVVEARTAHGRRRRVMYCGRCGAPLAPGATFCGRCGTPVAAQAAVAPRPMYQYPQGRPQVYRAGRSSRLGPAMIAGGLVLILIVVATVVGVIAASQLSSGGHSACTSNCSPKLITPLPEEATYHSSTYRFTVNYFSEWTVRAQTTSGLELGTKLG